MFKIVPTRLLVMTLDVQVMNYQLACTTYSVCLGFLQGVRADYDPAAYPSSGNYVSSDGHRDAQRVTSLQSEGSCCGPISKWFNQILNFEYWCRALTTGVNIRLLLC